MPSADRQGGIASSWRVTLPFSTSSVPRTRTTTCGATGAFGGSRLLAWIECDRGTLAMSIADDGRLVLRSDAYAVEIDRDSGEALIRALTLARAWLVADGAAAPIDVAKRVEEIPCETTHVPTLEEVLGGDAYGVFASARGPGARIGLGLRDLETPLDAARTVAMLAALTAAWRWLWEGGD
jgi:hypothetical protein